jgi:hypothetical protein
MEGSMLRIIAEDVAELASLAAFVGAVLFWAKGFAM